MFFGGLGGLWDVLGSWVSDLQTFWAVLVCFGERGMLWGVGGLFFFGGGFWVYVADILRNIFGSGVLTH